MQPVRFGIVSTAKIGRDAVIPAMKAAAECEVVAISSRDHRRAAAVAADLGIPRHYGSLAEMLDDDLVEAVYIPTPNSDHVEDAIRALRAGRHVLCEKPIGLDVESAERLALAQRQFGLHVSEAFMVRYHPRWLAARDIIRSGRLGSITQIHATFSVMIEDHDDIRLNPQLGGGALGDVGIYPITAARFLFEDEPTAVTATFQKLSPQGVDIAVAGLVEFPQSRTLLFSGALRQAWAHWLTVTGTEGWMELPVFAVPSPRDDTIIRIRAREDRHDHNVEVLAFEPTDQYEHQVRSFARAVRGEILEPWPVSDAVANMRVLDAVRRSAATGQKVPIAG
jgi:predicted dehydrogenase